VQVFQLLIKQLRGKLELPAAGESARFVMRVPLKDMAAEQDRKVP
jgi:hypothetical protein